MNRANEPVLSDPAHPVVPETAPEDTISMSRPQFRSIVGALAGNFVEWYDFLAYSIFSLYFASAFFPSDEPTVQLMNAAAIAAVGYVIRPLGSWLVGYYADKLGRKRALMWSIGAMCFGSLIISVTPTYSQAGIAAPAILIGARLLQGLSMGGEDGTSATYLSEVAPAHRRGFYLGFAQVSVVSGQLIALGMMLTMQHFLTPRQIATWGWRIPFAIGGLLSLFALYMRRFIVESEAFDRARRTGDAPHVGQLLWAHRRQIVTAIGITVGGTVAFYTYTIYMQKYLVNTVGLSPHTATLISAAALLLYMPLQPLFGLAADVFGRRPVLIWFGISTALFSVPLFTLLRHIHNPWLAFLLVFAGLAMLSGFSSTHNLAKTELFPTRIRALAVSMPYALTTSLLGGTTEFVALRLKASGLEHYFYWYVSAWAAISLITYIKMPETQGKIIAAS